MLKKLKQYYLFAFALIFLICSTSPSFANLDVRSAILMDMSTDKILYTQGADKKIPPASLTKIMTMYVVFDQVKAGKFNLSEKVKVSTKAAGQRGSRMHLKSGDRVTIDRLLVGLAVSSGNDAAMAVAEHVGGSEAGFIKMMNAKAKSLGMKNTTFKNPHGLPAEGQFTSARDMLTLSNNYLKTHPSSMRYHRMKVLTYNGIKTVNKNPLLNSCPGADGLKTGWIRASGYNLISTVKRGDTRLVGVVLGSATSKVRANEMRDLVEAGFTSLESGGKVKVQQVLASAPKAEAKAGASVKTNKKVTKTTNKANVKKKTNKKQVKAKTHNKSKAQAKAKSNTTIKTKAKAKPTSKNKAQAQAKGGKSKAQPKAQIKTQAKPQIKAQAKPQSKPQAKAQPKAQSKQMTKAEKNKTSSGGKHAS